MRRASPTPAPEASRRAEPPRPAPPAIPEPEREREASQAGRERAARRLATAYLDYWSAPNAVTLDATPDFYASRVEFHGREMSARALFEEKRRFVRRWPVRDYVPRRNSTDTTCSAASETCTVRTAFDYTASNPETGRRAQGVANLELVISFAGGAPVIVGETSRVLRSGRPAPAPLEEDED